MNRIRNIVSFCIVVSFATLASADPLWLDYPGGDGVGSGKRIVLISGDEEYRTEESMPQIAKILSQHHGFECVVLFAIDPESGKINPDYSSNIPGLESLASADLMIIGTRFRSLPDDQMKHIVDYVAAGKPIMGWRTATHAFTYPDDSTSAYKSYGWSERSSDFNGGFGRQILGETWIAHHGNHKVESTRGIIEDPSHPIVTGIADGSIWGTSDVYEVRLPLTGDGHAIVRGQILTGMNPEDPAVQDKRNDPMMPIAWTRTYQDARVFTTTMGAATDFINEPLRRMILNATLWSLSMEDKIKPDLDVSLIGDYQPSAYGFGGFVSGKVPADYK